MSEVCHRRQRERSLTRASSRASSQIRKQPLNVHDPVLAARIRKEIRQERSKSVPRWEAAPQRELLATYEVPRPTSMASQHGGVYPRSLLLRMRPRLAVRRPSLWKTVPATLVPVDTREPSRSRRRSQSQHPADRSLPSWHVPLLASDDSSTADGFTLYKLQDDRESSRTASWRSRSVGDRTSDVSSKCDEGSWCDHDCTFSNPDEPIVRAPSRSTRGGPRLGAFSARLGHATPAGKQAQFSSAESKKPDSVTRLCVTKASTDKRRKALRAHLATALQHAVLKPEHKTQNLHRDLAAWAWELQQRIKDQMAEESDQFSRDAFAVSSPESACSMRFRKTASDGPAETKSLRREALALLNKISPENELVIVAQLAALDVSTEEDLFDVADVVVDKAIHDPSYVDVYTSVIAELCLAFPGDEANDSDQPSEMSFRGCMLAVCQDTFNDLRRRMQLEREELPICCGASGSSEEEREEAHHKLKDQTLACGKFIAHLYLYDLVPRQLIEQTVINLFLPCQEEEGSTSPFDSWFFFDELDDAPACLFPPALSLVCLCDILQLIGLKWSQNRRGIYVISSWLLALQSLQANAKNSYPPRIRYIIQDLIEFACNAWVK